MLAILHVCILIPINRLRVLYIIKQSRWYGTRYIKKTLELCEKNVPSFVNHLDLITFSDQWLFFFSSPPP